MKNKIAYVLLTFFAALLFVGCAKLANYLNGATTNLESTSLAAASALRAAGITVMGTKEGSNWRITPNKISGKIMSVVIPSNGAEDEGITPFGSGRPDIAPANSTLYDFDLSTTTRLRADAIGVKPGFKGGQGEQIILLFGYFDVEFLQGTTSKVVRMVYGDTSPYIRGDKLLYNPDGATTNKYFWYSTAEGTFVAETSSRPASASVNAYVRDFSDPVRPVMHYYMLGANLRNCTDYDGTTRDYITLSKSVIEDNELGFTIDFDMQNSVVFTGVSSEAAFNALSDAELLQKFDMKQNTSGWESPGIYCSISFEATPKFK